MKKHTKKRSAKVVVAALADYRKRELTTEEIAFKHGVSTASLTVWAKKAALPSRNRGRRRQDMPTARQQEIIRLASIYKYDQVGARFGMHKQSVHRIIKRWRDWALPQTPPFAPGDVIVWRSRIFTVLDANRQTGTLRDEYGKIFKIFPWNGGRYPKKIGVNPKYVRFSGHYFWPVPLPSLAKASFSYPASM
jgi:hypothetical protein